MKKLTTVFVLIIAFGASALVGCSSAKKESIEEAPVASSQASETQSPLNLGAPTSGVGH